jgi:uncharacterized repeat protein (TIGR03803 family)
LILFRENKYPMKTRLHSTWLRPSRLCWLLFLIASSSKAQTPAFWGVTSRGGTDGLGTIFKTNPDGTGLSVQKNFKYLTSGSRPQGSLTEGQNGKLYGMTSQGGPNDYGVLFEYDIATSAYTKKLDFIETNGENPGASLTKANNNKLYGMTVYGGTNDAGVLFEYDPATSAYTKKLDFDSPNISALGGSPLGSLTLAGNGKLYGMTNYGGSNGYGVLFEYDPATSTYTPKFNFNSTTGSYPFGSLNLASNGKMYGMTNQGGTNSFGVLFEYDPATSTYTKKLDFNNTTNGAGPKGDLTQAGNGKMYGMTNYGGANGFGVLFEYDPATSTYTKKLDFNTTTGTYPNGSLVVAANGKVYGTTSSGGANSNGVLFEYDPATSTYTKKFDFISTSGSNPGSSLNLASNGKLYGLTQFGGSLSDGVLFEYDPTTSTFTKKLDFNLTEGESPLGSLVQANNGKFYGLTSGGGATEEGTLFEFDPTTTTFIKKVDFIGANGLSPEGSVVLAGNGKMYGMTSDGGTNNAGVLFEYDPTTSAFTKKLDFNYTTTGGNPYGSLVLAGNGKLYGLTAYGGVNDKGVIFEYDAATNIYTKKIDFSSGSGGYQPQGDLMQATNGKLFGMTRFGGTNDLGVIFEYDIATNTITKKIDFTGANGESPTGNLVQASNGKLYGMTERGGANTIGVLFEYDPTTNVYAKKIDFNGTVNGGTPNGSLELSSNGKLYGFTTSGGANNFGVLFEYDAATSTYTKKQDFADANGAYPYSGSLLFVKVDQTITFSALATKTFGDGAFNLTATGGASGNPVTFASGNTTVATVSGNTVIIVGAGSTTITASQAGDAIYNAAATVGQILTINKANQIITFNALSSKSVGDPSFTLGATASSGLAVSYGSSNALVATVSGNTVTIVDAGTAVITASQLGNVNYNAAGDVTQSLIVKANQTITFSAIADKTVGDAAFPISATASSSLPVSFSTTSTKITISGSQATIVSAGRASITAAQAGNANFNAAPSVDRSFCIKPAKPTVTLSNSNTAPTTLTSSAASGNQWFRNGTAISGATSATYNITQAGIFKVQVQVDDCISAFSDDQSLIITGTEPGSMDNIGIYPNPAAEELTIDLSGFEKNTPVSVSTVDLLGRSMNQLVGEGGSTIKMDVRKFTAGRYLIMLQQGKRNVAKSFIKSAN